MARRVLVVDDDSLIRTVSRRALSLAGFDVVTAGSMVEARSAIDAAGFDAALIDYFIGAGECGCDLIEPLRARNPAIWVAVVSGLGDLPDVVSHAHLAGADLVAPKVEAGWVELASGTRPRRAIPRPSVDLRTLKLRAIHGTYLVHKRNVSATARALGMTRSSLQRKLREEPLPGFARDAERDE